MPWDDLMDGRNTQSRQRQKPGSRWPPGVWGLQSPSPAGPRWAPVRPGPLQLSSSGGHGAHARPTACRACTALHALVGRAPGKLLNSVVPPPRDPHRTLPKIRWGSSQAFVSPTRRKWSGMAARPGAPNSNTHHVGGTRREGKRPAGPCACVEGRPAPAINESST